MYTISILWLLIIILSIILIKLLKLSKNQIITIFITLFIILFIINLNTCMQSTFTGLNLVIKAILPTIFPFSVICNLIIHYDGISFYSNILGPIICKPLKLSNCSSFPIVASLLCGYPLGCKYCCDLYELGCISKEEYLRLLNIASNASPIFLIGSVGAAMLGNIKYGFILLLGNYLAPLIIGFFTKKNTHEFNNSNEYPLKIDGSYNFGIIIKTSIENAINTTLQVGAFVIIFSIIIGIIKNNSLINIIFNNVEKLLSLSPNSLYGIFLGSIEYTNGCKILTSISSSIIFKLSAISFICSFSGLSIIGQISSFTGKFNVSLKKYSFIKFIQGIISFIITFIFSSIFISTETTSSIYIHSYYNTNKLLFFTYALLLLPLIVKLTNILFKRLHIS
ncbi:MULTISPECIES: sporulation integral membrane protein YlbJ [Clostridia]|uniref:Sporulation integral membrane protein YlbJ n=2 Tax=Clostridia TaxID=186801 RepID=A0A8I0ADS3_9CLOT|nr:MULTISPECIES: sporulation integral membrane protein YlbJ [Clostridia]MBC5639905.1 sporulation integral membrane protein YlbJ [Clostridium lentum]MBC5653826.1 sporulation integral membrane protein YlbJ [Blautia lenta]MEE0566751.1 sporulation integral membrane protein YlbJ [Clostridium sp.]OKZ88000.1 MAG: sporulation integral membrane protein YlbJ [Clostridium sp. 29_15]